MTPRAPWAGAGSGPQAQLAEFRHTYGLDQSLPQQFVIFLENTFTGHLGISLRYRVPVSDLIWERTVAHGAARRAPRRCWPR